MYNNRNNQHSFIDVNMFVPGLPVYENLAGGLIRLISRMAGFIATLVTGLARMFK